MRAVAILHIPDSPYGAVRLVYRDLAATLAARGGSLEVVTPDRFPRLRAIHAKWWVLLLPIVAAMWLWRRRRDYDIAFFHSYAGWIFTRLPSSLPAVTDFHGLEPLFYRAMEAESRARGRRLSRPIRFVYGWLMPRLLRSSCRRSRLVTCLNDAERRYLLEHGWTTSERLVLVRQSVPRTFFVPREEYAPRVRRVLVLSQWLETKGVHYLVEGFSTFSRRHPDVRLWCYGTRASESEVLSAFPEDVRDRVVVVPSLQESELPVVFQQADVFVHASLSEGSSNAVNQAMAAALPMVLTPVGVVNDVLTDGESCLLVPAADALAIDAALQRVIDDAGLRRRLGQSARRVAEALMAEARNDRIVDRLETIVTAAGGA